MATVLPLRVSEGGPEEGLGAGVCAFPGDDADTDDGKAQRRMLPLPPPSSSGPGMAAPSLGQPPRIATATALTALVFGKSLVLPPPALLPLSHGVISAAMAGLLSPLQLPSELLMRICEPLVQLELVTASPFSTTTPQLQSSLSSPYSASRPLSSMLSAAGSSHSKNSSSAGKSSHVLPLFYGMLHEIPSQGHA